MDFVQTGFGIPKRLYTETKKGTADVLSCSFFM
jgi:hypothetical protein